MYNMLNILNFRGIITVSAIYKSFLRMCNFHLKNIVASIPMESILPLIWKSDARMKADKHNHWTKILIPKKS